MVIENNDVCPYIFKREQCVVAALPVGAIPGDHGGRQNTICNDRIPYIDISRGSSRFPDPHPTMANLKIEYLLHYGYTTPLTFMILLFQRLPIYEGSKCKTYFLPQIDIRYGCYVEA